MSERVDPFEPRRETTAQQVTTVRHVVGPFGRDRLNPPSLGHLRKFVNACDGLHDDTVVRIDKGHCDEGGRYSVTFSLRIVVPIPPPVSEEGE